MESGIHHSAILLVIAGLHEIGLSIDVSERTGQLAKRDGLDPLVRACREVADSPSRIEQPALPRIDAAQADATIRFIRRGGLSVGVLATITETSSAACTFGQVVKVA